MKAKKILAVLVAAGAVLFSQASISEAHSAVADKPTFTFAAENLSLYNRDKFNYVAQMVRYRCTFCDKTITLDVNQNPYKSGYAGPCPSGRQHHMWHFEGFL